MATCVANVSNIFTAVLGNTVFGDMWKHNEDPVPACVQSLDFCKLMYLQQTTWWSNKPKRLMCKEDARACLSIFSVLDAKSHSGYRVGGATW